MPNVPVPGHLRAALAAALPLLLLAWPAAAQDSRDEFLGRLVGEWALTGTMGETTLSQRVMARWILQGHFVEMRITGTPAADGKQPYEAVYLIGHDRGSDEYLFHLFDTFGASYARTIGIGQRRGDAIDFRFDYPGAPFSNRIRWDAEAQQWQMQLRQQGTDGQWHLFATKTLTRIPPRGPR